MKLIIKLCLVLLVAALALPMWIKGPDGRPIMELSDWVSLPAATQAWLRQLREATPAVPLGGDTSEPGTQAPAAPQGQFYRWQDEQGVWHFSDRPPQGAETVTAQALPTVRNRMDEVQVPEPEAAPASDASQPALPGSNMTPPLPDGVSREALEAMLQDAHERRMGDEL